jgi:hypothetical protein
MIEILILIGIKNLLMHYLYNYIYVNKFILLIIKNIYIYLIWYFFNFIF